MGLASLLSLNTLPQIKVGGDLGFEFWAEGCGSWIETRVSERFTLMPKPWGSCPICMLCSSSCSCSKTMPKP